MLKSGCGSGLLRSVAIALAIAGGAGMTAAVESAAAQEILELNRVSRLAPAGQAAYRDFLMEEFRRAFAVSDDGGWGWHSGAATADAASAAALADCAARTSAPCRIHAVDGDLVLDGQRVTHPPAAATYGEFASGPDYFWYGPARAKGAIVWSHGNAGQADARNIPVPPYVRQFSNAGWDVYRFDRDPRYDRLDWAIRKLIDGARQLRAAGYRRVIAAGQSRGAWHSLEALHEDGLLDGVIAAAPARHGTWSQGGMVALQGLDDYRTLMRRVAGAHVPVALFVFTDDPFDPDPAARAAYAREQLGAGGTPVLVVERPSGITGHRGAQDPRFNRRFGACILSFLEAPPSLPAACPDAG
jgi:hypothetical protein